MTTETTKDIAARAIRDVADERARQVGLGWTRAHDVAEGPSHVLGFALERIERAIDHPDRKELIQAAALILAAIEVVDTLDPKDT